jgi:GNAT superfamily N-acetyltransferase
MTTPRASHSLRTIAERVRAPREPEPPSPHLQLEWRPLAPTDVDQLVKLISEADEAEGAEMESSAAVLVDLVGRNYGEQMATLGGFDRAGLLRAYAGVLLWPGGDVATVVFYGAVDPTWSGRGIGRALLAWQEGSGRQLLSHVPGSGPARLSAFVEEAAADRRRLYLAAGFSPKATYLRLRRDLAAPIEPAAFPDGLEVRCAASLPESAVREAHIQGSHANWGEGALTPELWHREWGRYRPEWSFAVIDPAEGPDVVVGYALARPRYEAFAPRGRTEGLIHRLGVIPSHRGRGIGRALATRAMQAIADSGLRFATAVTDPDVPNSGFALYDDLGFARTTRAIVYGVNL